MIYIHAVGSSKLITLGLFNRPPTPSDEDILISINVSYLYIRRRHHGLPAQGLVTLMVTALRSNVTKPSVAEKMTPTG
jgi:hypothetical protein